MMAILLFLIAVVGLTVSAFCSGMETGFLSVRRERVMYVAREGSARAKVIAASLANLGRTLTAILVGNNLANVTYSAAMTALAECLFGSSKIWNAVSTVVVAVLLLVLGEFLPKLLCSARPLRRLLWMAQFWQVFARIFVPVGSVVQLFIERMLPRRKAEKAKMTPEAVLKVLEDRKDGVRLSDFERVLIGRLMDLRTKGEFVTPDSLTSALTALP